MLHCGHNGLWPLHHGPRPHHTMGLSYTTPWASATPHLRPQPLYHGPQPHHTMGLSQCTMGLSHTTPWASANAPWASATPYPGPQPMHHGPQPHHTMGLSHITPWASATPHPGPQPHCTMATMGFSHVALWPHCVLTTWLYHILTSALNPFHESPLHESHNFDIRDTQSP